MSLSCKGFLLLFFGVSGSIRRPIRASLGDNETVLQYGTDGLSGGELEFFGIIVDLFSVKKFISSFKLSTSVVYIVGTFPEVGKPTVEVLLRICRDLAGELGIEFVMSNKLEW